jgi:hypothetical protein
MGRSKLMNEHLKTLARYPPVHGSKAFDLQIVVEQFMDRGYDGPGGASGAKGQRAPSAGAD